MNEIGILWRACPGLVILEALLIAALGVIMLAITDAKINPEPLEAMEEWEDGAYDV